MDANPRYICTPTGGAAGFVYAAIGLLAFLGMWAVAVKGGLVQRAFFPAPQDVATAFAGLARDGTLWREGWASAQRIGLAVGAATVVGVPIGVFMGAFGGFESILKGVVFPLRTAPITAFIPIFMAIFGVSDAMKVWFLAFGTIVYVIPMTFDAVRAVPTQVVDSAVDLGFRPLGTLWYFVLPEALPRIFDAIKVCTGVAWTYLVAAEIVNITTGLGAVVQNAYRFQNTPKVWAGVFAILVIGWTTDQVLGLVQRTVPVLRPEA